MSHLGLFNENEIQLKMPPLLGTFCSFFLFFWKPKTTPKTKVYEFFKNAVFSVALAASQVLSGHTRQAAAMLDSSDVDGFCRHRKFCWTTSV